jgi:hypothetical protein
MLLQELFLRHSLSIQHPLLLLVRWKYQTYLRIIFNLTTHELKKMNGCWCWSNMNMCVHFDNLVKVHFSFLNRSENNSNTLRTLRHKRSILAFTISYNLNFSSSKLSRWAENDIVGPWAHILSIFRISVTNSLYEWTGNIGSSCTHIILLCFRSSGFLCIILSHSSQ